MAEGLTLCSGAQIMGYGFGPFCGAAMEPSPRNVHISIPTSGKTLLAMLCHVQKILLRGDG
jgi:hypothetical protein